MSGSLETYLVKLYLDRDARRAFLEDPQAAATEAGLAPGDVAALQQVDREGLELAARSFAHKRAAQAPRTLAGRLRAALRRWRGGG